QCVPDACGGMTLSFERAASARRLSGKCGLNGGLIRCLIPIGRIYVAAIIKIFSRLLICFSFLVLKPADENGEIFSSTFR
ncbi:hypothetical protein, partial [Sutterella wadsworthensis]|uniref:hypothetical protein n=1 Tax=Sutterella wadsworthensis TaxID=40545 RepID=UPI003AF96B00